MKLRTFGSPDELFQAAAGEFATRAVQAVQDRGRFCVALSGGSTPKGLFTLLASGAFPSIPWDKTFLFWGDERHVPPGDPDSNFRMTSEALLSKISIPDQNIFRIKAEEQDAEKAAVDYEQTLRSFFNLKPGEFPRFDLTLNGVGTEGHTASLFPDSPALKESTRLVVAQWVEKFNMYRITLTLPVFNHAACVLFLAAGKNKALVLKEVVEDPRSGLPAQRIHPTNGELLWFVDQAAASQLKPV
jgi:6-phosphogluconolactonase